MRRRVGPWFIVAFVLVAMVPAPLRAQEAPVSAASASPYIDPAGGLGLDEAIARAREREPGLQASRADAAAARDQRQQSGLRPNPSLMVESRQEPGGTDSLFSVGVEWPLDLFRREGRVQTADLEASVVEWSAADRERALVADVVRQYGRAAAAIREAQLAADLAATVEARADSMRARADEGAAPRLESDLLEVERHRLRAERDLAQGRAERALIALKPLLGMRADERLVLREPLDVLVSVHAAPGSARAEVAGVSGRPDVRVAIQQESVAAARLDLAQREGRFDVSVFGTYMRMDAGFPQLGLSPAGVPERVRGQFHYVAAGATVMLPLLDRNQGQIAAARAARTGAEARRKAVELAAASEVASAAARVQRARQAVATLGDGTRALARRNLEVVRQTFELGRATVFDVLTEQRRFVEFEQAYTSALLEVWEAYADLRRAVGGSK